MVVHLLSSQLIALINIKVCGTFLWSPIDHLVSLDTPGTPLIAWRSIRPLLSLGLLAPDEHNRCAVLTMAGEKIVEPHQAAMAATTRNHLQARARAKLDIPPID